MGSLLFFWSSDYFRHFRHYTEYTVIKIAYNNWPFRSAWVHCVTLYIIICPFVRFVLSIVLSVRLRYTDSDYPFGIFCPRVVCSSSIYGFWLPLWYLLSTCCLFVFDIRILITPLVSFVHCVVCSSSITDSDYPFGIFCPRVVCSSSIYGFWLPLWYLLSTCCLFVFDIRILITSLVSFVHVLSVRLRYTDSDYPFGIFCPLCCLFVFDIRILITPLVSFVHVLSVRLRYTDSDYPFGIFCPRVVCSSSIYGFWLPLWYLLSTCCLFVFDIRILITPLVSFVHCVVCSSSIYGFWLPLWYLLSIVLSVRLRYTILITPLVSCVHCVVCSSSIYGFWLPLWYLLSIVLSVRLRYTDSDYPFGIFCPLCCLFVFDIRILITPLVSFVHCVVCSSSIYGFWLPLWYLLSIVLSVRLRYTDSDYPFGIFCPRVVCSSSIYGFWLPLWYLLSTCCLFVFDIRILITPLVSFVHVLSVRLRYTNSDYLFGIFCPRVVCSSSIYGFWLPLWYLLSIVLSVRLRYTDSDYPFGIFCPRVVCSSSIYGFWLPLWYLLSTCCLFVFDIRILITSLVSFVHVLSVRLRYTDSDYPFGIFCPLCCLFVFDIRILITSLKSLTSS